MTFKDDFTKLIGTVKKVPPSPRGQMKEGKERSRVPVLFLLACAALLVVGVVVIGPKWSLGGCKPTASVEVTAEVARLQAEVEQLRKQLGTKEQNSGILKGITSLGKSKNTKSSSEQVPMNPVLGIDLHRFLGHQAYHAGVSWDVFNCAAAMKDAFKDIKETDEQWKALETNLRNDLINAMAEARGMPASSVNVAKEWPLTMLADTQLENNPEAMQAVYASMARDPAFYKWRRLSALVLAKYLLAATGEPILAHRCNVSTHDKPWVVKDPLQLGKLDFCPGKSDDIRLKAFGYLHHPYRSINALVEGAMKGGVCTQNPEMTQSYGQWLVEERMGNPEWHTFNVPAKEEDQVTFLFDIMYEKHAVFRRQYWMGVITMQNPFDMYSIQDIIYTVRPDLIIETGTANGGSALLWASIMELNDIPGRIVTMDMDEPAWDKEKGAWGGKVRNNPRESKLWKKYVTFIKGNTVGQENIDKVKAFASKAKRIMVLLDSDHSHWHVAREMEVFCPLVTPGSYCLVEDTKMSRWASIGPLPAVKEFLTVHPEFEADRTKELIYSHHVYGYLKRKDSLPYEPVVAPPEAIAAVDAMLAQAQ